MKLWSSVYALAGSLALVMLNVAVLCVPAAPPTPEAADAGMLRAPEPHPKRGGMLKWGGLANSTLYDLHQTGTIANMGPQAPMYDLLVQVDPVHWDKPSAGVGLARSFAVEYLKHHPGASVGFIPAACGGSPGVPIHRPRPAPLSCSPRLREADLNRGFHA